MLVTTQQMLRHAADNQYAVAAFNTQGGNYDIIRAICQAAEKLRSPVILAHYLATGAYSGLEWFVEVCRWLGGQVSVPVAIHLDHGDSYPICLDALQAGFTSLMIDGSTTPVEENAALTSRVIGLAKGYGVPVEAEIGELQRLTEGGEMLENKNIANPDEVKHFLSLCRPDSLAIGIGNAHGYYSGVPDIHLDVLDAVRGFTDIPLVLHGCTGMPEDTIRKSIEMGVAKINFGTEIRCKYVDYTKEVIAEFPHQGHAWKISMEVARRLQEDCENIIRLAGSEGKA